MADKMIRCETCGEPIAASAKNCPHCGARNKHAGGCLRLALKVIGVLFVIWLVLGVISALNDQEPAYLSDAREIPESQFMEQCQDIAYEDLVRNEEEYAGTYVRLDVQVHVTMDDKYYAYAKSGDEFDETYWTGDTYDIYDMRENKNPKILEQDFITVYGIYTSCNSIDEPEIAALYIVLHEE